ANTYITTSVQWGDQNAYGANAPQTYMLGQQSLTFTHTYASVGTYTITFTVTGPSGSNVATATVVVTNSGSSNGPLSIQYLSPSAGTVGTLITLQGNGFTTNGNIVHFGVGGKKDVASGNGTSILFTIPSYISPCDVITTIAVCNAPSTQVTPGTYPVY